MGATPKSTTMNATKGSGAVNTTECASTIDKYHTKNIHIRWLEIIFNTYASHDEKHLRLIKKYQYTIMPYYELALMVLLS